MLARSIEGSIHEVFNVDEACSIYSQSDLDLGGCDISSPFDVYSIETLRDRHDLRIGAEVAADVFVWALGEPQRRQVTKIGGMPYWPTSKAWPTSKKGKPLDFVAQFNFQDSFEVDEDFPGDILLLFRREDPSNPHADFEPRWMSVKEQELVSCLPSGRDTDVGFAAYGVRHRTADYPDSWDACYDAVEDCPYAIPELRGTKIGGTPGWIQGGGNFPNGTFLCQLGSVQIRANMPWPWVNRTEPQSEVDSPFMIGDCGCYYFFLYPNARIWEYSECY